MSRYSSLAEPSLLVLSSNKTDMEWSYFGHSKPAIPHLNTTSNHHWYHVEQRESSGWAQPKFLSHTIVGDMIKWLWILVIKVEVDWYAETDNLSTLLLCFVFPFLTVLIYLVAMFPYH